MNRYIRFLLVLPLAYLLFTTISAQAQTAALPALSEAASSNIENSVIQDVSSSSLARFAVIGDYGLAGPAAGDVANRVKSWNPDFIVSLGDNNYASGSADMIDANIGQYYHDYIFPYTGIYGAGAITNRFFPILGNHDWVAANARPYLDYFSLPGNERYYDFVQGPVHFFVLDSDSLEPHGISQTSIQAVWLRNALAASSSPWNIVLLHHAPFSSGTHGSNTDLQWPFEAWGADAVLAGHDHTYERIIKGGMLYFVNGLGGSSIYDFGTPLAGSQYRYNNDYGAMLVDATAATINFQFITRTGVVVDQYALSKGFAPLDPAKLEFQETASGLTSPIVITNAGDGSDRIFIAEQTGTIRILKNGVLQATPFLDIHTTIKSGGEQGLLALAFHPSYSTNGMFFVVYTAPRAGDATGSNLVLKKFSVSANNPDLANPDSGVVVLTISHPVNSNHNGGGLAFGADGYLYWSTGDGGDAGDPLNNAQQLNNLLGKILRIDVNSGLPYAVPTGNPFYSSVDPNIKKEIWAYGLRNPWRFSFDRLTHDLYLGDVGQSAREEVDFQAAGSAGGANYGWRVMEGRNCYNPSSGCNQSGKILPVAEYSHALGCSITGGYVYRGLAFPSLQGYYLYGDFCSGRLFSLYNDASLGWTSAQLLDTPYSISTFGEDEHGELYLADYSTGNVYLIRYPEDLIPPTVISIVPTVADPNLTDLNFTVTFSEPVSGVDNGDFSLTTTGVSGAAVSGVSGSGSVYAVRVNTGSGDGTVRLNAVDNDSIKDTGLNPLGGVGAGNGNFTSGGTYTVVSQFAPVSKWTPDYSFAQGWRADLHPRVTGDVNGDGKDDLIGFGYGGVFVALSNGINGFQTVSRWSTDFSYNQGWRAELHPRMVGDMNGDGADDLVGFGYGGVFVALSNGVSGFQTVSRWSTDFTYNQGWRAELHSRVVGDVNGDGADDLIGFGNGGVFAALSNGVDGFQTVSRWSTEFSYHQGWRADLHPRMMGDVNGDGVDDAVGFGNGGVFVALSNGVNGFQTVSRWTTDLSYNQGWRTALHPRMLGDMNGDGKDDLIGFGYGGIFVALSDASQFLPMVRWSTDFSYNQGWRTSLHPRMLGNVDGDLLDDVVGFGSGGVWISIAQ